MTFDNQCFLLFNGRHPRQREVRTEGGPFLRFTTQRVPLSKRSLTRRTTVFSAEKLEAESGTPRGSYRGDCSWMLPRLCGPQCKSRRRGVFLEECNYSHIEAFLLERKCENVELSEVLPDEPLANIFFHGSFFSNHNLVGCALPGSVQADPGCNCALQDGSTDNSLLPRHADGLRHLGFS